MPLSTHYTNGESKDLVKARNTKYRRRQRLAMALLHAAEARGMAGFQAIAILQNIPAHEIDSLAARDIREAPNYDPNTLEFEQ